MDILQAPDKHLTMDISSLLPFTVCMTLIKLNLLRALVDLSNYHIISSASAYAKHCPTEVWLLIRGNILARTGLQYRDDILS